MTHVAGAGSVVGGHAICVIMTHCLRKSIYDSFLSLLICYWFQLINIFRRATCRWIYQQRFYVSGTWRSKLSWTKKKWTVIKEETGWCRQPGITLHKISRFLVFHGIFYIWSFCYFLWPGKWLRPFFL